MTKSTTKVLLDTDIGSDIDDAVCLAYLLSQPRCDLLGITTVAGQSIKRAELASVLCRQAGRDIPIYPGADVPLVAEQKEPEAGQAEALGRWDHETRFPSGEAVQFLRDTIRRHPGEIVLVAIGPLTNIALLFSADPEVPSLLKGLVMMCGVFAAEGVAGRRVEWNAACDPHAAAIVYRHPVKIHRSVGLDVTMRVTMPADEVKRRFQAPLLKPVLDFAQVWFRNSDQVTFHDPLAAATLFDENICRFERGTVSVELAKPKLLGMTRWANTGAAHEVAVDVDADRFFREYFGVFGVSA